MSEQTGNGPTQEQLLNATTPEALAALMAAEAAPLQQGVTAPATAPAQADAAPAPAATDSASPGADSSDPVGVATKSGKGVLPFRVLLDERQEKQHWRGQALTLQQQLEQAQARIQELQGKGTEQQQADALADLTDDEIAAAEADFPLLAKVARRLKAAPIQQAPASAPAAAPAAPAVDPQDEADDTAAAVHAALTAHPLLSSWQQKGGVVWGRAVELDDAIKADPTWANKPLTERFGEVQRRLAGELGVAVPPAQQTQPAPAPAPATTPEPANFRPNTLSDLGGGAATQHDPLDASQDGMALARRFASMTPDQIAAAVRRSV